jgi:hypothetical protein
MSGIGIGLGVRGGVIRQTLNVLHEALHRHSSVDVSREIHGSVDLAGDPLSGSGGQTDAKDTGLSKSPSLPRH